MNSLTKGTRVVIKATPAMLTAMGLNPNISKCKGTVVYDWLGDISYMVCVRLDDQSIERAPSNHFTAWWVPKSFLAIDTEEINVNSAITGKVLLNLYEQLGILEKEIASLKEQMRHALPVIPISTSAEQFVEKYIAENKPKPKSRSNTGTIKRQPRSPDSE